MGENIAHARLLAQSEESLPPIVVHRPTMRVVDGMHRLRAAELRGEDEIEVRFIDGDEASSFVLGVSENVRHGLPLSTTDRKAAAARIIDSYPEWSDRMVASVTGLSAKTVATTRRLLAQDSKPRARLYTVGCDGRVRPRDSAQRRESARRLMAENPGYSLRKVAQLAGISPETARDVRNRLNGDRGAADPVAQGASAKAARPAPGPGRGPAAAGPAALRALRADPAFRSTESGRSLLRMLIALQVLEGHGDQLFDNIPVHCTDRVALAARACAGAWEAFAQRLDQRSRVLSGDTGQHYAVLSRAVLSRGESSMPEPVEVSSRWFLSRGTGAAARVFCFPHAGGNPRLFLNWQQAMGSDAQIVAMCPPGRGPRADEPAPATFADLADGAAQAIRSLGDAPTYLYGHSLGALVAFEVARRLPAPRDLVVSGLAAPSLMPTRRAVEIAQLDGQAFVAAVASYGGLPGEILAVEEAYHLLLPGLQADFRLIQSYRYIPGPPLNAGLTIINGRDDPNVDTATLAPWAQEFSSPPRYHWVDGGHFFLESQPGAIVEVMRRLMRSDLQHAELI